MKKRTLVLGDIHGAFKSLLQCLSRSAFDYAKDNLIVLGEADEKSGRKTERKHEYYLDHREHLLECSSERAKLPYARVAAKKRYAQHRSIQYIYRYFD